MAQRAHQAKLINGQAGLGDQKPINHGKNVGL